MFITPQNAYTQGEVLEGGAFEGWVGREGRALAQEIVAITKKCLESQVVPSMKSGHSEESEVYSPEEGRCGTGSRWHPEPGLPAPEPREVKFFSRQGMQSGILS